MKYWHIQLKPVWVINDETIIRILEEKSDIGLGSSWNDKNGNEVNNPKEFKSELAIYDIVMISNEMNPLPLVRVESVSYVTSIIDENFDLRRKLILKKTNCTDYGRNGMGML